MAAALGLLLAQPTPIALAQQPVRPLPRLGPCPHGYVVSGSFCMPAAGSQARGAIERVGSRCPQGFSRSGAYCLSDPGNGREAIVKSGPICPRGWVSSAAYCLSRP